MDRTTLIYRVLSDKATDTEKKELEEWIALSEANKTEYDDIKLLWQNAKHAGSPGPDFHFYDGLEQIKALMRRKHRKRRRKRAVIISTALVLIALMAVAHFFFPYHGSGNESQGYHKFDNEPLDRIIDALEKDYDVQIEVENKGILACRFTGTFYNDPVKDMLHSIADGLSLSCESPQEGEYLLKGKGCFDPYR